MALSEKTKVYLKYALANQDVADEVISSLENEPTSDAALAAHVAAPNPHPQYDTSAEVQAQEEDRSDLPRDWGEVCLRPQAATLPESAPPRKPAGSAILWALDARRMAE
jgi:hypothetical protein